ncbi:unnamed protein product, partial [marine sediment metagenome]
MMDKKSWEVWDDTQADKLVSLWGVPSKERKGRHQVLMKRVSELIVGGTVLDVGCGLGHLFRFLKKDVKSYLGVD